MGTDFRTWREKAKGHWMEERSTVPCMVHKDGLLVEFQLADVEVEMDKHYPRGKSVWYFNNTLDREIAEVDGQRVVANPRVLWDLFMPKTGG